MADRAVSDQPTVYTMDQLKDVAAPDDIYQRVRIGKSKKGAVIVLPLVDPDSDNAAVRYIFDGSDYWHRADTKAAQAVRKTAERQVKNRG